MGNVENLRDSMYWIGDDGRPGGSYKAFGTNKRQLFLNLWGHKEVAEAFAAAWRSARSSVISDDVLTATIRNRAQALQASAAQDMAIWSQSNRCAFWYCCRPSDAKSFEDSTSHLLSFLLRRAKWVDENLDSLLSSRAYP